MARDFIVPRRVVTGSGSIKELAKYIDGFGEKALIVCGASAEKLGRLKLVTGILSKKSLDYAVFSGIHNRATIEMAKEAYGIYSKEKCDYIIGIGGGNALDIMKAVAFMDSNSGEITGHAGAEITAVKARMIAIPTTAGTGSEVTGYAQVSDVLLKGEALVPELAIVDASFTYTLPPKTTADTGLDALTHAIEAYTSKDAQPLSDTLALSAIKRIFSYLPLAYRDGSNEAARREMSIAAVEAGMAYNNSSETLVQGMSGPMGATFNISHGISNAILISACMEYARDGARSRFADMARAIGAARDTDSEESAADRFLSEIRRICDICQVPTIEDLGISKDRFMAQVDKMAKAAMNSGSPQNTRREVDEDTLRNLYCKLCK